MAIINRMRRRAGLPKRRLLIVNAPERASQEDIRRCVDTVKALRLTDAIVLPHGYAAKVAP